jgi:hypothetical protein
VAVLISLVSVHNLFSKNEQESGPHFADIIVTTSDTHLLLFGELRNSLTEEMIEGLHNGIPIKFSFFVKLERNEDNWPDEELTMLEFTHSLTYDTLKTTYVVHTEETSKKKHTSQDLADATQTLNEINGLKIIELSSLRPENTYRLKVKADIYKKTLPMSLHNIIPFVSWWDLNTDWYTVEFIY